MTTEPGSPLHWPGVSVIIPTLNEARNLPHVFARLPSDVYEVIIVDGHSVDDTLAVVRELRPDARIVMQSRKGKGNALACGFAAASGDIVAMVDADGSADAAEIPRFVEALLGGADFAKGTRFAEGGGSRDITGLRRLGNHLLTGVVNLLYGTTYTDLCYGYNAFWRKHLPALELNDTDIPSAQADCRLWGDGFEIETLINIRIARADLAVVEVPSFEHSRIHGVSNLSALSDGLRVLRTVLHERFRSRRRRRPEYPGYPERPKRRERRDSPDMMMVVQQEPSLNVDVAGSPAGPSQFVSEGPRLVAGVNGATAADDNKPPGTVRPRQVRNSQRR
jgi:glycosyltransferase involved in cell wall biosynthesis